MGTPTPPIPLLIGDNCLVCDGILWPVGQTPLWICITVSGLEQCPLCPIDPPDGDYWIQQRAGSPCKFDYNDSVYRFNINFAGGGVNVDIFQFPAAGWFYFHGVNLACDPHLVNDLIECGGLTGSKNGTVDLNL